MFHVSLLIAATNYTKTTDIGRIPPIEQDHIDPSEFAISPRRNSMELLSMMCMYSQTLTQAKRSHSQHIKRLAAALKSAYHLGIVHHLSAPTVLNAPNLHISDLKHSFARYVLSATQTYKQCETRTVVPPKPISAKINAEERENDAWPVVSTATQSGVEQVLDMTLPTTRSKVSVNESCHKPSKTDVISDE